MYVCLSGTCTTEKVSVSHTGVNGLGGLVLPSWHSLPVTWTRQHPFITDLMGNSPSALQDAGVQLRLYSCAHEAEGAVGGCGIILELLDRTGDHVLIKAQALAELSLSPGKKQEC